MMADCMPKEQYDFIREIQRHMLDASNMTEYEAWDFAFRVWQFQDWLLSVLERRKNEAD